MRTTLSGMGIGAGLVVAALAGAGIASARQEPGHPVSFTGTEWMAYGSREKQAYLSGFVAGAAAEQVFASAGSAGNLPESTAVSSGAILRLRAGKQLHFPYAPSVYSAQLDDYYWWTDHRATRIVDVMITTNRQMLHP